MGFFSWFSKKPAATKAQIIPIRARYDAAQTNADNSRHWAMADSLSARKANSPEVRRKLRDRARYEVANNSYARGIINSLAAYTIGTGPTLALQYAGLDSESADPNIRKVARQVEQLWQSWFESRGIAAKLLTMRVAMAQDGEAFGLLVSAPSRDLGDPIYLDMVLIESDQVEDTSSLTMGSDANTGVRLDRYGRPTSYAILPEHPGDSTYLQSTPVWVGVDQVIHCFKQDRPGQVRGIPEVTPALEQFAQLRRFTLATLTAAETAADFAAILSSQAAANDEEIAAPWERIEFERGAMVTAPNGMTLSQMKAEHPNATYDEFVRAIMREIARCLSVPAVIALGDASSYNYASGRLDIQTFQRQMEVDRANSIERACLAKLWRAWLDEALLIDGYLPAEFVATAAEWKANWRWPAPGSVDRQKEANGQAAELANHTTTLQAEYAKKGLDWEAELRQRAREISLVKELGLSVPSAPQSSPSNQTQDQASEDEQSAEDDQEDSAELADA